jgi:ABC-type dipeptide/oligopeptide/nickel transport system permease component
MLRYVAHRVALGLVSLLLLSMMIYAAAQVLPGDPGRLVLGREAQPSAVKAFNHQLGIDRPLPVRYADWLSHAVRGDFSELQRRAWSPTTCARPRALALPRAYAFVLCVLFSILAGAAVPPRQVTTASSRSPGLARRDSDFVLAIRDSPLTGVLNLFPGTAAPSTRRS